MASPLRVESSPAERGAGGDRLDNVYGIDLAIRGVLARHPVRYALANPLALASVFLPPVRVIFSLRLVRSMFRRGHLARFLLVAAVLVLNGAVVVYGA